MPQNCGLLCKPNVHREFAQERMAVDAVWGERVSGRIPCYHAKYWENSRLNREFTATHWYLPYIPRRLLGNSLLHRTGKFNRPAVKILSWNSEAELDFYRFKSSARNQRNLHLDYALVG